MIVRRDVVWLGLFAIIVGQMSQDPPSTHQASLGLDDEKEKSFSQLFERAAELDRLLREEARLEASWRDESSDLDRRIANARSTLEELEGSVSRADESLATMHETREALTADVAQRESAIEAIMAILRTHTTWLESTFSSHFVGLAENPLEDAASAVREVPSDNDVGNACIAGLKAIWNSMARVLAFASRCERTTVERDRVEAALRVGMIFLVTSNGDRIAMRALGMREWSEREDAPLAREVSKALEVIGRARAPIRTLVPVPREALNVMAPKTPEGDAPR